MNIDKYEYRLYIYMIQKEWGGPHNIFCFSAYSSVKQKYEKYSK